MPSKPISNINIAKYHSYIQSRVCYKHLYNLLSHFSLTLLSFVVHTILKGISRVIISEPIPLTKFDYIFCSRGEIDPEELFITRGPFEENILCVLPPAGDGRVRMSHQVIILP